jgi:hypothetical protein
LLDPKADGRVELVKLVLRAPDVLAEKGLRVNFRRKIAVHVVAHEDGELLVGLRVELGDMPDLADEALGVLLRVAIDELVVLGAGALEVGVGPQLLLPQVAAQRPDLIVVACPHVLLPPFPFQKTLPSPLSRTLPYPSESNNASCKCSIYGNTSCSLETLSLPPRRPSRIMRAAIRTIM